MTMLLGSDVLVDGSLLRGRTVGLVCNPASVDGRIRHIADRLEAGGVRVGALFGPQHGIKSDLQENMTSPKKNTIATSFTNGRVTRVNSA